MISATTPYCPQGADQGIGETDAAPMQSGETIQHRVAGIAQAARRQEQQEHRLPQ
jgi:hypothetical protein